MGINVRFGFSADNNRENGSDVEVYIIHWIHAHFFSYMLIIIHKVKDESI